MRRQNSITPIYTIGFVCEGEKTEPFFVNALYEKVKNRLAHVYSIDVHPTPVPSVTNIIGPNQSNRKKNNLVIPNIPQPDPLVEKYKHEPMPNNWVLAGKKLLESCSEVWVLFDKDGHNYVQQAFKEIENIKKQGKRFNVVFSSRCFEHYMLMHYEMNTLPFEKSECNRKENNRTVYADCLLDTCKPWGCDGTQCINGYARAHEYWKESKNEFAFKQCRNLWWGILNAFHLKWESLCTLPITTPLYCRNPYLNIYQMTLRLMEMVSLEPYAEIQLEKGNGQYHKMSRKGNILHFECQSIIPINNVTFTVYELLTIAEIQAVSKEEAQLLEKQVGTKQFQPVLLMGKTWDVDLTTFLPSVKHYAKLDWGGINYFIAPVQYDVPPMTSSQIDAFRIITISQDMIKTS